MTQKADTMNLSIPKEKLPFAAHSRASIFIIGLSVLALLALAFYAVMPADTPALVTMDGGSQFAISPELQLAQRFAEEAAKKAEAAFLAANPELIAAGHFSAS